MTDAVIIAVLILVIFPVLQQAEKKLKGGGCDPRLKRARFS